MSRLTKKDIEGAYDFTYSNGKFVRGICPLGKHPHQEIYSNGLNKLGKIEDLMEKYEIEDLVELEIALDQYFHRNEKVETRRANSNEFMDTQSR